MFGWRRKQREHDLDRELRTHLELEAEEQGDLYAARRALGNQVRIKEDVRATWGWTTIEQLFGDLRFALRVLRSSPAFTIVALGSLALGIGANTAIFELVNAVRLRSLPVPNPQQLVRIQIRGGNRGMGISGDESQLTYPLFLQIRDHQQAFSGVLAWSSGGGSFHVGEGEQIRRLPGILVSGDFFSTLHLAPAAGRLFTAEDDHPGCAEAGVVLGYRYWQTDFGGQLSAIGRRLIVEGHPFEVIGVAPANFSGLEVGKTFDLAFPMCVRGAVLPKWQADPSRTDVYWLTIFGRLKTGWTSAQASQHLEAISRPLMDATLPVGYPAGQVERYRNLSLEAGGASNGISSLRNQYDTSLSLLLGITGLVLLIACSNVANLMLARATARAREFAVRVALGAPRIRLIRQAFSEGLLLASGGALLGLALSRLLSGSLSRFLGIENDPLFLDLNLDSRVLLFTATMTMVVCILFGIMPALRASGADPLAAMKSAGRGLTADRERFSFQRLLVVFQIAVSLVLLVGALLFIRSFRNLATLDPGFRERGIVLASFDVSRLNLDLLGSRNFERGLLSEIRSIPQVDTAATTSMALMDDGVWSLIFEAGRTREDARVAWVSPGHFDLLDIPILSGRDFSRTDTENSPKVVIVNQKFARRFFGNENPIGRTFRSLPEPNYPATEYQVVGMVRDTKYFDLRQPAPAMVYAPSSQDPTPDSYWCEFYVRSQAPPTALIANIRRWIAAAHPGITPMFRVFQVQIEEGLMRERLMAALSGFFGILAALLAVIGLYGVIAYLVEQRRNEIGIRIALGARPRGVIGLVMKEAAVLGIIGLAIGAACALVLGRATASLLFGLSPRDPLTLISAAALLAAAIGAGSFLPARRASQLDPLTALRSE